MLKLKIKRIMTFRLVVVIIVFMVCVSCKQGGNTSIIDMQCASEKLNELDINADIQTSKNNKIIIILKKPYKTVAKSQQRLLLDFLISCFHKENLKDYINFTVALDKEIGKYENRFYYKESDVLRVRKKSATLLKIHKYILKEFDKTDMIALNSFIKGFYNLYPYKEDIYNIEFIELVKLLKDEKNDSYKAKLTFLLIYGTSKVSKDKGLKDISKHLKTIWDMLIESDIDKVLSENFNDPPLPHD